MGKEKWSDQAAVAVLLPALRWVTLLPIAFAASALARPALVLVAHLGLTYGSGGAVEPDSQEFEVMSWLYGVAGSALASGLPVWIAWRWAPSRRLGAAVLVCGLVCLLGGAALYAYLRSPWPYYPYDWTLADIVAGMVGALLGLAYVLSQHWGDDSWLEQGLFAGWHGAGQVGHMVLAGLATLPLWWWAADPLGEWHRATASTSPWAWPFAAGGWLWRMAFTGVLTYVVAFVLVLLLLLAVKLPFVLAWHMTVGRRLHTSRVGGAGLPPRVAEPGLAAPRVVPQHVQDAIDRLKQPKNSKPRP